MSYKFDSLVLILNKLDRKEHVTVKSLMDELEVSDRTVYRYLKTLEVAGFPIEFSHDKGSYVFTEGYSLNKPALSMEEQLSFSLAKRFLASLGDTLEQNLSNIEEKLAKKSSPMPEHIYLSSHPIPIQVEHSLRTIFEAIQNYQRLEINYKALYSNEETFRKVDPYYLFFREGFWHLRGFCHLREEFRTFALDRILSTTILTEYFIPDRISPAEELDHGFGVITDGQQEKVVLKFDKKMAPYIVRRKWHSTQKEKPLRDGSLELTFEIPVNYEIRKWIYQWLPYVAIIAPKELKETVTEELRMALDKME